MTFTVCNLFYILHLTYNISYIIFRNISHVGPLVPKWLVMSQAEPSTLRHSRATCSSLAVDMLQLSSLLVLIGLAYILLDLLLDLTLLRVMCGLMTSDVLVWDYLMIDSVWLWLCHYVYVWANIYILPAYPRGPYMYVDSWIVCAPSWLSPSLDARLELSNCIISFEIQEQVLHNHLQLNEASLHGVVAEVNQNEW